MDAYGKGELKTRKKQRYILSWLHGCFPKNPGPAVIIENLYLVIINDRKQYGFIIGVFR